LQQRLGFHRERSKENLVVQLKQADISSHLKVGKIRALTNQFRCRLRIAKVDRDAGLQKGRRRTSRSRAREELEKIDKAAPYREAMRR
jgi:hypothetical protein